MSIDRDTTRIVQSWLREDDHVSADRILDDVLAAVDTAPQRRPSWWSRSFPALNSFARFAIASAAVVVVTFFGINLLPQSGGVWGPSASASPVPAALESPSASEPAGIVGLPPEGATPSSTEPGELVVRFEGTGDPWSTLWVYADGRLISSRYGYVLEDSNEAFIGLTEQRLSPSGVEYLRSEIIATSLFASDLALAREDGGPFLEIHVWNGDRLVRVTWAHRLNWKVGQDAPIATAEQARALTKLSALLTDQGSWPTSAWEDETFRAYVPSLYSVCFGVRAADAAPGIWLGPIEPEVSWAQLPESAQDLLRAGVPTQEDSNSSGMHNNGGCSQVTTDDARALTRIFQNAGIHRNEPETGAFWLGYSLSDQSGSGNEVWIQFGPVLPHGEAIWLGPG
jgi:hypothetical protein